MKLPLVLEESGTVRDADGRVVISKINPCTIPERREIVHAKVGQHKGEGLLARSGIAALPDFLVDWDTYGHSLGVGLCLSIGILKYKLSVCGNFNSVALQQYRFRRG